MTKIDYGGIGEDHEVTATPEPISSGLVLSEDDAGLPLRYAAVRTGPWACGSSVAQVLTQTAQP